MKHEICVFLFAQRWFIAGADVFPWPVIVLFGWGIGVAAHGVTAFKGEGYIEQQTEKEYKKLKINNFPRDKLLTTRFIYTTPILLFDFII